MKIAVINISPAGEIAARKITQLLDAQQLTLSDLTAETFTSRPAWVFVGALGICVRAIAPHLADKHSDPAVVCVDATGRWVIPVVSGHIGGANYLASRIAQSLDTEAIITTASDNYGLWPLDTIGARFGWKTVTDGAPMNEIIARFVNRHPTALFVDVRSPGSHFLETTAPPHVTVCHNLDTLPADTELVISLSPRLLKFSDIPVLRFIPPVLSLGIGCRKGADPQGVVSEVERSLLASGWLPQAVASVATIELKKQEPLVASLAAHFGVKSLIFSAEELSAINVPNPSPCVLAATGSPSVAEAAAIAGASGGELAISKLKRSLSAGSDFTFALAQYFATSRQGHIEIVGAGPGDPELISIRGRRFLEEADLVLYAGSLVPEALVRCVKSSATVRSSADMTLEEQFDLMQTFYKKGALIVRLHTGDPCIYGAIGEQMAFFDRHGMRYHITPGISSFQAAAAELRTQFTIPERVQTIILTRGEGRTSMPEREKLSLLARSQSTMCIFLSAGLAPQIQSQLLEHYPLTTPVAVCHHLTWPDQRIWLGQLQDLAAIVERNCLTLTTMIVVGEAIGNRDGLSRLYSGDFQHLFRP